jgi:hypothetical protein
MFFRSCFPIALAGVAIAASLEAQSSANIALRVHVVDSMQVPVVGAEVSVVRGLQSVLARGVTDARGTRILSVPRGDDSYQVSVRKIGYAFANPFVRVPSADTLSVEIVLRHSVQTLEEVVVTAEESLRRRTYHIDADAIAQSTRNLIDATDIVTKLRPDMLSGRSGECSLDEVWINGRRIRDPLPNEIIVERARMMGALRAAAPHTRMPLGITSAVNVMSVLSTIKPEHVDEMTYNDCLSQTLDMRAGSTNALFVVLKPGVGYEDGRGSFVAEEKLLADKSTPAGSLAIPQPRVFNGIVMINGVKATEAQLATLSAKDMFALERMRREMTMRAEAQRLPLYRRRIIGVFDLETGQVLGDVELTDAASGATVQTSSTGTTTLSFLKEGAGMIRLRKKGFAPDSLSLVISPQDTVAVTAVLRRMH